MKWLVTILAILVGVLLIATIKLASSTPVDSSAEALRAMAELREALQHCEAANPPTPVRAPAREPTFEDRLPTETGKQKCMREAERLGKVAALWCAGL
jgi:hypothetical protein